MVQAAFDLSKLRVPEPTESPDQSCEWNGDKALSVEAPWPQEGHGHGYLEARAAQASGVWHGHTSPRWGSSFLVFVAVCLRQRIKGIEQLFGGLPHGTRLTPPGHGVKLPHPGG